MLLADASLYRYRLFIVQVLCVYATYKCIMLDDQHLQHSKVRIFVQ